MRRDSAVRGVFGIITVAMSGCGSPTPPRFEVAADRWDGGREVGTHPMPAARARPNVGRPLQAGRAGTMRAGWRRRGDFDGDGRADLVVGLPGARQGSGRVLVFTGATRMLGTVDGTEAGAALGTSVAFAGDVNGDGYGDIVVGAPGASGGSGSAWWIAGGRAGAVSFAGAGLRGSDSAIEGAQFGATVAGVGDVNADGFDDVAVGAPGAGLVDVFLGGPDGPSTRASVTLWSRDGSGSAFGAAIAGAGDADGDGYSDVVVGSPGARGATGRVGLFLGGAGGTDTTPAVSLVGIDGRGGEFGAAVALVDFDGDGFGDLAVASPGARGNVGRVRVYFGGRYGVATEPGLVLEGLNVMDPDFGRALVGVADQDDDVRSALLVGAPGAFDGDGWTGLFTNGTALDPARTWANGDGSDRRFGGALAAGDLDGDGRIEVVIAGDTRVEVYPAGYEASAGIPVGAFGDDDGPLAVAVVGERP